jgi:hypothetical protein
MYKLCPIQENGKPANVVQRLNDGAFIPFAPDNTDYAQFKKDILEQQPGGAVVEDGDSFSLNVDPDLSILEDADGVQMTIEQAQDYVRTLP